MNIFPRSEAGKLLLVSLITVALCVLLLFVVERAMGWLYLALACGFMAAAAVTRRAWISMPALTLMSVFLVLFTAETYLSVTNEATRVIRTYNGQTRSRMSQADAQLGYCPVPVAAQTRTVKTLDGRVAYDVLHTSGSTGWRVTPQHPEAERAVLFFGCSFTAGVGVNDDEVYPWQVAQLLGAGYQVYNFGVGGYGPHQFLALLQSERLDAIFKKYRDIQVFFLNIDSHERRSAGMVEWDSGGPRYVLEDGRAVRRGTFADAAPLGTRFDGAWKRSELFRDVLLVRMKWRREQMLTLQQGILVEAQRVLKERDPQARMTVLLNPDAAGLASAYREAGLVALDVTGMLPGWPDPARYEIPDDRHPTPAAHAALAQGIAAYIRAHEEKR